MVSVVFVVLKVVSVLLFGMVEVWFEVCVSIIDCVILGNVSFVFKVVVVVVKLGMFGVML